MNKKDNNYYTERYNKRFKLYGYDIRTLGWGGDKTRQELRFEVAMNIQNFTNKRINLIPTMPLTFSYSQSFNI